MARKPGGPATYDDILALPEHVVGEIIDGELIVSPRPRPVHALATSSLGADIHGAFHRGRGGPGGWWILDEPELHFRANVLVPDIAGWRVPFVWLVDPAARTLEVLRLEGESWMVAGNYGGDEKVHAPMFEAVELDLSALWEPAP
jgi:hypothetical protein